MSLQPDATPGDGHEGHQAPVIADGGSFGRAPQLPSRENLETGGDRNSLVWGLGVAATIVIGLWAIALSVSQATSREVARPVSERGVAVLTGIDGLLDLHLDEVRATAEGLDDTALVALPGYPALGATWLAVEARTASRDRLRGLLLSRTADLVYVDGVAILAEGGGTFEGGTFEGGTFEGGTFEGGTFSTSAGVRRVLNTLSQSNHDRASTFVWPLGLLALALSIALAIAGTGFARYSIFGTTLVLGALPAIVIGAGLRAVVGLAGSDGTAVAEEFSELAATVAWMPARTGVTLFLAGLALIIPALVLHALFDRSIGREPGDLSRASR